MSEITSAAHFTEVLERAEEHYARELVELDREREREVLRSILNTAGAYCGDCSFEGGYDGPEGCADCLVTLTGYADALIKAGWSRSGPQVGPWTPA